jgi:glutamate formiminotransferase
MDPDHNRSVITFAGEPDRVAAAAVRGVAKAVDLIDLNLHSGVHPRIGAADVVPFVPLEGVSLGECVHIADAVAQEIWSSLGVPVYLYEAAARRPERKQLENVRRAGFENLREAVRTDPSRHPDIGEPRLHPTAGATAVGARKFLIAYNINLRTSDLSIAAKIARTIRASSGGFPHVKALGLPLATRNQVQVSMNLTDFELTPLHAVHDAVRELAEAHGVELAGSEIIGLIPKAVLERAAEHYLRCENFQPDLVLENRLSRLLPAGPENDPARTS